MITPEVSMWFAVQVMPRHEQKVALQFRYKNQEHFLPTGMSRNRWSDRTKVAQRPLFPGYVFCRTRRSSFGTILNTPGVHRIVSFGGVAYPIPESEIHSLQQAMSSGRDVATVPYITIGQKVQVASGPLAGVTGIVSRQKNRDRLIISVEIIMKSISVDVESSELISLDVAS